MVKFIRRILIAFTAFLLLAIAGVIVWLSATDRLFSSPTKPRPNSRYQALLSPPAEPPAMPDNFFSDVRIITNKPHLEIAFPVFPEEEQPSMPFAIIRTDFANPVQVGPGTLRPEFIGVAYTVPKTNFDWGIEVPMRVFGTDLQEVSPEEAFPGQTWRHTLRFQGEWPQMSFLLATTNFPHLKVLGYDLFDATTHWNLSNSRTYGLETTGRIRLEGDIKTWRPVPVELIVNLAAGPVQETLIAPEPGAEVRSSRAAVKLVAADDGDLSNWSSSGNGRTNTVRLSSANSSSTRGPISTFVFLAWPNAYASGVPIEFEALDASGKVLSGYGGGSSGRLLIMSVLAPLKEVRQIRVRIYENLYRVVISIPELPGLPQENRHLENLFDTRIPYLRTQYEFQMQSTLKALLQMEGYHLPLVYPNGYFPIAFTNITARDLFEEMNTLAPAGQRLVADPEQNRVELREPPLVALWKRVKSRILPP